QHLDGNFPSQPRVPSPVHFPHAARAQRAHDFVGAEATAGSKHRLPQTLGDKEIREVAPISVDVGLSVRRWKDSDESCHDVRNGELLPELSAAARNVQPKDL